LRKKYSGSEVGSLIISDPSNLRSRKLGREISGGEERRVCRSGEGGARTE
jgi:hypothetical protein